MKRNCWQPLFTAIVLITPCVIADGSCRAAAPPTAVELGNGITRLEDLWKAGKHREYFIEAARIASSYMQVPGRRLAKIGAALLATILARESNVGEYADDVMASDAASADDPLYDLGDALCDLYAMDDLAFWIDPIGFERDPDGKQLSPLVPIEVSSQ